jgi:ABC-type antimicrobial peptide transport system permease subunit
VSLRFATPGFFDSLKIPLKMGRDISESDTSEAPFVAVVSASFAREHYGIENPIGRRFNIAFQDRTVVGVVGDIRVRGLEQSSEPQVYLPYRQVPDGGLSNYRPKALVIRMANDSNPVDSVRKIIQKVDPEIPVAEAQTLNDVLQGETESRATQIRVLGAFALLSILLASIGIHGLLAFSVSQRIPEIGLRMALGAQSNHVLQMVLQRGLFVAAIGASIGLVAGYSAARAMQALLAGIPPGDLRTFLVAGAVACAMTISGCALPALRALRIDPAVVLRTD